MPIGVSASFLASNNRRQWARHGKDLVVWGLDSNFGLHYIETATTATRNIDDYPVTDFILRS